MYRILLVEDNLDELHALKNMILEIHNNAIIDAASSYYEALQLIQGNQYSFYFFDIQLESKEKGKTGIDLAHIVRSNKATASAPIIFITTVTCNVQEAVNDLHCYSYINKPYRKEDIAKCFNSLNEVPFCKPNIISCKDISGVYLQITIEEIVHITADRHTLSINCTNKSYKVRQTSLDNILTELGPSFIKCHKSHIVNKAYINSIDLVTMKISLNGIVVPIGRAYKANVTEWSS